MPLDGFAGVGGDNDDQRRGISFIFKEFAAKPINHKSLHSVETLHALHLIGFPRFHLRVLFLRRNCLLHLST